MAGFFFAPLGILTFVLMDEGLHITDTEFGWRTRKARPAKADYILYHGYYFNCGCGKRHVVSDSTQVLNEVGNGKLILQDKGCEYKNCVKITKRFLGTPKGLKTLFSTATG